jgi:hypothetical protein
MNPTCRHSRKVLHLFTSFNIKKHSPAHHVRGSGWVGLSLSRRRRLNLSNTRLADFLLRWWFTDFLTQIFADFPLNSTTLASYVLLRLSRQIFQLFNKVDSAGKFLPLRRIHTADISLGSDMLLLLLFLSYRRDTFYWLYSSPKP